MKYVSVKQIRRLDSLAIEKYGVPSLVLMENAGRSVAQCVIKNLKDHRRVCIVCGQGNNAGDGLVAARHLINAGICVDIIIIGKGRALKTDAAVNYLILKRSKIPITELRSVNASARRMIAKAAVVVDAIFGVGLNRPVTEPFKSYIESINRYARKVISVDIPSGLDGNTGKIFGVCIKANTTVTFSYPKKGFTLQHGPRCTGKIMVVDIGIPRVLKERIV